MCFISILRLQALKHFPEGRRKAAQPVGASLPADPWRAGFLLLRVITGVALSQSLGVPCKELKQRFEFCYRNTEVRLHHQ